MKQIALSFALLGLLLGGSAHASKLVESFDIPIKIVGTKYCEGVDPTPERADARLRWDGLAFDLYTSHPDDGVLIEGWVFKTGKLAAKGVGTTAELDEPLASTDRATTLRLSIAYIVRKVGEGDLFLRVKTVEKIRGHLLVYEFQDENLHGCITHAKIRLRRGIQY